MHFIAYLFKKHIKDKIAISRPSRFIVFVVVILNIFFLNKINLIIKHEETLCRELKIFILIDIFTIYQFK